MAWGPVLGHDHLVERFRRALGRGRLASTFLFSGPEGIGKRTFAYRFAQSLLCDRATEEELNPCGQCSACQQVLAGTHPDIEFVGKPADSAFIPLELLIGDADHRMRAGLCYNISLKPFSGKRRIAIIDDADYFRVEAANALLKTLEEPPPGTILILLGTSPQRQLPTIRSRCQLIRFLPLNAAEVQTILLREAMVASPEQASSVAEQAEGSLARAKEILEGGLEDFSKELYSQLSRRDFETANLVKATTAVVDAAGKEAPAKRARLKQIVQLAMQFYEGLLASSAARRPSSNRDLEQAISAAERWWPGGEAAALCLELCLSAWEAIEANASPANLLEYWYDELAQRARLT